MANVLFTTYCNNNCSYCFAREKVELERNQGDPSMNMTMEGLEEVICFYKRSQLRRFVVLGGEPTLHPDFIPMIDRILQEKEFRSVIVFSNGLIRDPVLDYLADHPDPRLKVALNLNAPESYLEESWNKVSRAMKRLGGKTGLGVNIYRPGQDYEYLIAAIKGHRLGTHIRLGLTHPIIGSQNLYAREEDFPAIAEDIVKFAERAYENALSFSFDCGFRFCMFTLDQHRELLRFGISFKSHCSPIIDIGPDLSVWRCFPLIRQADRRLSDFETKNQMIDFYEEKFRSFALMGNMLECAQCRYRLNGLCRGGCLTRTIGSFHGV